MEAPSDAHLREKVWGLTRRQVREGPSPGGENVRVVPTYSLAIVIGRSDTESRVYLRHSIRRKDGKAHTYWRLVRSVRCNGKVVQQTVAQLGELDAQGRARAQALARQIAGRAEQYELFEDRSSAPTSVAVRLDRIRLERSRSFGDVWLGWTLWRALDLDGLCSDLMVDGREEIPWATMAAILTIARLCEPSSELHIAEDWYRRTALEDLLGVPSEQVNDDKALSRARPAAAAQGCDRATPEEAARRAVRARVRPVALRRDEHLLRGARRAQSAGEARPQPRPPARLQAGVHRAGGHA
jgi:DNA-binding transcriptional regulator YdaS (Cro superfamily)